MKLTKEKARRFHWEGLSGWAYNEKEQFPHATAAYIEVTSSHGKIKNPLSDIIYFIVDGKGEFYIDGKWVPILKDDVVIIPKDTPYDFLAINSRLKLFCVHTPGYKPGDDIELK